MRLILSPSYGARSRGENREEELETKFEGALEGEARQGSPLFLVFLSIGPHTIKRGSKFLVDSLLRSITIFFHKKILRPFYSIFLPENLKICAVNVWPVIPGYRPV
jgi:hypothetical protein